MEPTQTCEALAHEDKKAATVKKQAASKAAAGNTHSSLLRDHDSCHVCRLQVKPLSIPLPDIIIHQLCSVSAKKATKVKNWKNTDSGQFWWHDQ